MTLVTSGQVMVMGQVMARTHLIFSRTNNIADCIVRCHRGSRVSKTLRMESESKRPICPSCSKPTQLCLCKRMRSPCLDNQVTVTVLQHSLERKHALNSTRIARLGLKNVSVTTVFDIHNEAEFVIRAIPSSCGEIGSNHLDSDCRLLESEKNVENLRSCEEIRSEDTFKISMGKRGVIQDSSFDHILASSLASMDVLAKGFVVTKFSEGKKEFELEVPSGSALLFPSQQSVKVADLKGKELKVKNLIVLDGTWSKARRMYLENPWLKLLCCHVKLEIEGTSLYGEVRRQPRAGCLSTLESIVYAMKELGEEDSEGLDNMLNVFESMVEDQRRCKDENLVKII